MIFWPHGGDLGKPPELEDLRYRRPAGPDYWESPAGRKDVALEGFWIKWKRKTGNEPPRPLPRAHVVSEFSGCRLQGSRRPDHLREKKAQDARVS